MTVTEYAAEAPMTWAELRDKLDTLLADHDEVWYLDIDLGFQEDEKWRLVKLSREYFGVGIAVEVEER